MEYRLLGRSGLRISALTMGTMTFGGGGVVENVGNIDVAEARKKIDMCIDAGMNLFDTANVYSTGESEKIIGKVLASGRSDQVLIATKAGWHGRRPERRRAVALPHHPRRRGEPRAAGDRDIDLYQVHEWDGQTPLEETIEALDTLVGRARCVTSGARIIRAGRS